MNIIKQRGTSTVEFAMMMPVLLILIFMVTELGTIFYRLNAVTKSVQIAARYLSDVSVNNTNTATDKTNAMNLAVCGHIAPCSPMDAVAPGLVAANIVVTNLGQHVQVVATYDIFSDSSTGSSTDSFIFNLGNSLNALIKMVTGSDAIDFTQLRFQKSSSVMRFTQ